MGSTLFSVSFETCFSCREDIMMGHRCRDVPIRCCGEVALRRLDNAPSRHRWVFHLRRIYEVAGAYRETLLRRPHNFLLPCGKSVLNKNKNNYYYNIFLGKGFIKINPIHNILNKCLYIISATFDRIDISGGIDFNITSPSKECDICHCWHFLNFSFKFQPNVCCDRCYDLLMTSINFSDIAILNIKGSDYRCIVSLIGKNEAINLMQNVDLTEHYEA